MMFQLILMMAHVQTRIIVVVFMKTSSSIMTLLMLVILKDVLPFHQLGCTNEIADNYIFS